MSEDDIDLDRVVSDPRYRRRVIEFLNGREDAEATDTVAVVKPEARDRMSGSEA